MTRPTEKPPLRHLKNPRWRRRELVARGFLDDADRLTLAECPGAWNLASDRLIENAIGAWPVPLGVAEGFIINGREMAVPMATEERSIIAAASKAAKLCRPRGFTAFVPYPNSTEGHALWSGITHPEALVSAVHGRSKQILDGIRRRYPGCENHGRILHGLSAFSLPGSGRGLMTVCLLYGTGEAMGANAVTRAVNCMADEIDQIVGRRRVAAIVTNDSRTRNLVHADADWPASVLPDGLAERILDLQAWAATDRERRVTHVKGIMNGVSAVCLATGQDVRAVEAAVHATPGPLTHYELTADGGLHGRLSLPLPTGTIGGATGHPMAQACLRLIGATRRQDLAAAIAAVGLAQNFGALLCLANEGINEAHRRLKNR